MPDNKLKQFHDSIKGNPNISGVPEDFSRFESALKNPSTSKAFFDAISKNEAIGGLPKDYNTFASSLGIVEKKNPNVPTASSGMGVLLAGKGKAQQSVSEQIVSNLPKTTTAKPKEPEEDGKYWERTKSTLSTLGKSVVDGVFATSAKQIAIVSKTIDDEVREMVGMKPLSKPIEQYQTYQWGKSIESATDKTFQPNPEFKGEIQEQVAQTAGDLLGLVATAIITKNPSSAIAKMGTKGIVKGLANSATRREITRQIAKESVKMLAKPTTFVAAAQTGTRNYDEAKSKGATDDQANAMFWSTAITGGIVNNLPVGSLLNRFDKASGGKMKDMVVGGVVGGVEEAVTEGIEQISTNFAAKNIYDETRTLFEGLGESVAMGGGIGFVLNAMGVKLGSIRNKYKGNPEKLAEIDKSIDYIKDIAEKEGQSSAIKLSKEEENQIDRYSEVINNPQSSPEEIDIANEKIQEITGQKIIDAESSTRFTSNLSEDTQVELKLIDSEIERLREAAAKSDVVDIRDQLELDINKLNAEKDKIINQSNEPQGSRIETPISDSLNSVENTTEALGKKDTQFLKKQLGIEANWDMVGEGDVLAGNDPVLAYTKRKLPDWHKESQRGNIDANSKITYDIQRQPATRSITLPSGYVIDGSPELVNKDVAYAKDENGVIIGMIELETLKDGKNGIRHIAVAPEFRGKGVSDKLIEILKENNPQLDLSKTKLRSKGFEKAFGNKVISEAYHKAKSDGSNPELVKAVEDLFATKQPISETPQAEAIVKPVTLQGQVDQLRKDEQAEYDALPDPNDEAARKKIYDRYNKKITPLLKQIEEAGTKSEIIKLDTEASPAVLANEILDIDFSSAEEVSTGKPLTEREQQMITVPQEMPRNSSKFGSWLKSIGEEFDKKTGTNIYKGLKKILTTGDLKAVRAREIVDSEAGVTIDKVKRISTKIQNLIGKDRKSRELANTVMSVDRLDDKISKLAANDNYTAISEILDKKYTPSQIKAAMNYYKNAENGGTSTITKKMFDSIVKDMSGIGAQKIADKRIENAARVKSLVGKILNYDTVGKSQENVVVEPTLISGSQSPMLTGSELAPVGVQAESRIKDVQSSTDRPVSLVDLRTELASMPNGKEILNTLDKSIANQKAAESELSKTEKGRQILEQAKKARELIDSFADWANTSQAANKINKRIGETLAGNKGSYLKRSFRYWKDKKFEPSEAMKLQALESVVDDMMIMELTKLKNSPEYKRLRGDAKRQYLTQIADDVRRKAKIELDTYMDENRQKREDGTGFSINTKAEKIDGKTLSFRKLIDESFLDLLGNVNDPISQFHDTVVSQTQIKSAANFHWILNEVTGKENIYDSREQLVEFNGSSKGFKQINDSNSVLDGKWVSEDIYDVISSNAPTKDGTGYLVYRKILSTMRKSKTIYNFFAGWTTNLIGGEVTLAANGIVNNPKKIGKYLINRAKYIKNPEALTADIQKDIDAMKDNGFWSTSVSAGTIKLLDDNYMDMTAYDRGDETARTATRRWIDKAKRFDDNVVRNYSVIDDFTKLVFFREKKDVFSRKLYGKKFDELSKEEQNIVHANVAERGKENIATMSRLPRIYHKIAKYPLGDFMAFRISAIKSGINTINNARRDIEQGYNKDLSPEQRKAYLEDAFKTLAGMSTAAILNSSLYGAMSTLAMGLMSDDDEEVFNPVVEDGVDYGSKSELYTDFKGTPSVNPQWMRGKNNVVIKDDGKGNIELLNISNKDPYDELFGLFLPRAGTSWDETLGGVLMETISPNMTVNLLMNIKNGEDQWGRSIFTGDDTTFEKGTKIAGYVLTEALVPPAIKNTAKETYKEIQQSKAVEGDTKKEINKKTVGGGEYFNALLKNTPMLLNRTYKVNLEEQFGYYAKEFYQARPEKFGDLDKSGKEKRYEDLKRIKDGYEYLKRYSILNKNSDFLDTATEQMFEKARGISDEEQNYILYGEKVY